MSIYWAGEDVKNLRCEYKGYDGGDNYGYNGPDKAVRNSAR